MSSFVITIDRRGGSEEASCREECLLCARYACTGLAGSEGGAGEKYCGGGDLIDGLSGLS